MGTNYYAITDRKIKVTCDCGFEHEINERLHIGKNSYGWMFALQCIPEKGIFELKDWMPILKEAQIKDEYDEPITYKEMMGIILKKGRGDKLSRTQKERLIENAKGVLYHVDLESWLLHGKPKGEMGNYVMMEGDYF